MLDGDMVREGYKAARRTSRKVSYAAPSDVRTSGLSALLRATGRRQLEKKQLQLLCGASASDVDLYFSGDLSLLDRPCIAIVGSREASDDGRLRAARLARELVESGFIVVSGLASGIDTAAHTAAIAAGGGTVAVIGTPLSRAYPSENAILQQQIYSDHLLISPFREGEQTFKSSFPKRNRVMAALTDATVIIEASDTSGTLHQAAECVRLGRWLFIAKSLVEKPDVSWPRKFLTDPHTRVLTATQQIIDAVIAEREANEDSLSGPLSAAKG